MPEAFEVTYLPSKVLRMKADAYVARIGTTMRPAMKAVAERMELVVRERFDTETDPDGRRWRELSDAWKKRKKKLGARSMKILHFKFNLRDTGVNVRHDGESVTQGANLKYARIHQLGAKTWPSKGIPPRPYIGWSRKDLEHAEEQVSMRIRRFLENPR